MKNDFNGDGKADVLWQNTSGSRALWLMNGSTFGNSIFLPSVATSWKIVGAGDFNGDNKPDILWQNSSGARLNLAYGWHRSHRQCEPGHRRDILELWVQRISTATARWTFSGKIARRSRHLAHERDHLQQQCLLRNRGDVLEHQKLLIVNAWRRSVASGM